MHRIFREAGATVRKNVFLKDMNVEVGAEDASQIEVFAQDLPCFGRRAQFAVDITLRCALSCEGEAHPHAADTDGAVVLKARADKEMSYPELATSSRCKLVVMAKETGGRWSDEAAQTIRLLSHANAREAPSKMRCQVALMCGSTGGRAYTLSHVPLLLLHRWLNPRSMSHGVERVVRRLCWPTCLSRTQVARCA